MTDDGQVSKPEQEGVRRSARSVAPTPFVMESQAPDGRTFGELVGVLAVVLTALQLIPAFALPRSQWPLLVVGVVLLGGFSFAFMQASRAHKESRRRFLPALVLLFVAAMVTGYKIFELRSEIERLEGEITAQSGGLEVREYLEAVVAERKASWDGEFETRYARPTLYMLNSTAGTREQSPMRIHEQLLLWRTGTEGIGAEFRGVAGLVGDSTPGVKFDQQTVARGIINYVDRPLADSDLLNKRLGDTDPARGKDDIPRYVLVLGDPAAGKSAMLERLDMIQARRALGGSHEPVPVLINLKGVRDPTEEDLMMLVRERLGSAADSVLGTRKVILLVDALDESGDPQMAARAVANVATGSEWDRVIVTARLRNYASDVHNHDSALWRHNFTTVILYGLDQTSIEKQILTRATPETRQKLFRKLADSTTRPAWLQFLRLPLNFDLVCGLMSYTDSDILPQGQAQLIESFVDKRFDQRGVSISDAEHCKDILTVIAVNLLGNGVESRSKDFGLEDCFDKSRPGRRNTTSYEDRLRQMVDTGIIIKKRLGGYRFFHLNVQDYFTARGLEDLSVIDASDVHWREIILFRVGMRGGQEMLSVLQEQARGKDPRVVELLAEATSIWEAVVRGVDGQVPSSR